MHGTGAAVGVRGLFLCLLLLLRAFHSCAAGNGVWALFCTRGHLCSLADRGHSGRTRLLFWLGNILPSRLFFCTFLCRRPRLVAFDGAGHEQHAALPLVLRFLGGRCGLRLDWFRRRRRTRLQGRLPFDAFGKGRHLGCFHGIGVRCRGFAALGIGRGRCCSWCLFAFGGVGKG